jgi:hypothetical protein
MEIQNVIEAVEHLSERLANIEEKNRKMLDLLMKKCDEAVGGKKEAAKFIGYDEQTITTLLGEGRIINYGRGRIFIFHKSELLDLREVRVAKD